MNNKKLKQWVLFFSCCVGVCSASFSNDITAGKVLYEKCSACHGKKGEGLPSLGAPAVAGQNKDYITRQLEHFKQKIRGSNKDDKLGLQMQSMASVLVDQTSINNVASYIASMPVTFPKENLQGNTRRGNSLYQGSCGACHGGQGQGNSSLRAPRLSGLHRDYMIKQMRDFKLGIRGSHPNDKLGKQMQMMATTIASEASLLDILVYLKTTQMTSGEQ